MQGQRLAVCSRRLRPSKKNAQAKSPAATDFFIGAHALAEGYKLLTRDAGRYKTYFPKIKLI
jgi:hypothetical protein